MPQQQPVDDFDPSHADQTVRTKRLAEIDAREEKRWKWVQWFGGVLVAAVGISLAIPKYIRTESHEAEHATAIGDLQTEVKALSAKLDMLILFSARQNAQTDAVAKTVHAPIVEPMKLTPPPATVREAK